MISDFMNYILKVIIDIFLSLFTNLIFALKIMNYLLVSWNLLIFILSLIGLFLIIGELISLYRYNYYKSIIKSKKLNFDLTLHNDELITLYLNHVKKHIINDQFSNIFNCYFPNQSMTIDKIKSTIKYYLFGFDSNNIKIPLKMINTHKGINQLTRILSKRYVVIDDNKYEKNSFLDLSDLDYKFFTSYLYKYVNDYKIKVELDNHDFDKMDYEYITIYKHKNKKYPRILHIVSDLNEIDFNKTYFYVHVKCLDDNLMNNSIPDINKLMLEMKDVMSKMVKTKFSIEINNYLTVLVPIIIEYFDENIESIFLVNPICYPYSYHKPFISKQIKNLSYEKIYLFHNLSLLRLLTSNLESDIILKKDLNKLYSHKTHIIINDDFINNDVLITNLILYSNIDIHEINKENIEK